MPEVLYTNIIRSAKLAMRALGQRIDITGLEHLPTIGPTLLVANHDSYWDPVAIGVAARNRRQVRALSKSTIWKYRPIGAVMNGMGHIPIERGKGDAHAMDEAIRQLRSGVCIGVFPEGTRSLGRELRARSGVGRLAQLVPEAVVVCVRTNGSTDVVRAPRRPSVSVEFFRPRDGQLQPGESALQGVEACGHYLDPPEPPFEGRDLLRRDVDGDIGAGQLVVPGGLTLAEGGDLGCECGPPRLGGGEPGAGPPAFECLA